MILLINYADNTFREAQHYNSLTAKKIGKVDDVIEYGPQNIERDFLKKNEQWFVEGDMQIGKYGLWRPLILQDAYSKIQDGDYLIYADSGTYFVNDVHFLTKFMDEHNLNVLVFNLPFLEKEWTKRDVFIRLNADSDTIVNSNQRLSTCFAVKKSKEGEKLIESYRQIALLYPELFTDQDNLMGEDNYLGFIQNRHNQSVLSVLTKTMGINAYRDPTEYGINPKLYCYYDLPQSVIIQDSHEESSYPQILVQHRRGKVTTFVKIYGFIRSKYPCFLSGTIIRIAILRHKLKTRRKSI